MNFSNPLLIFSFLSFLEIRQSTRPLRGYHLQNIFLLASGQWKLVMAGTEFLI
jgi:hypothetical protein